MAIDKVNDEIENTIEEGNEKIVEELSEKQKESEEIEEKQIENEKVEEKQIENEKIEQKENEKIEEKPIESEKIEDNNIEQRKFNNYNNPSKKFNKTFIICIIIAIVIAISLIFSTIFALLNITNTKIIRGIQVNGIEVSGLTKENAIKKVDEILKNQVGKDINMSSDIFSTSLNPEQIQFKYKVKEAIDNAYEIGRNGNIFQNNFEIIKAFINKKSIPVEYTYNNQILNNLILDIETKLPNAVKKYSYYIEDGNLIITPGTEGAVIKKDVLANLIIDSIKKEKEEEKHIEIPTQIEQPLPIDIEKIHTEIYTEPKDAYYTKDPFVIYPEVYGVDFSISIDEAKQMIQEPQENYTIKLNYTKPAITKDQIGVEAFPDLISSFTTKYDVTNRNRSNNLKLASDKINGTVLMPGEEFSYNQTVGERTIAAGYKEAKIFSNGKVIDGLGGGICQISSTLYNSVLYANLEVTSRRNHQFVTSYIKAGLDATVVYGSTDFKFKNTRKYPIKIVSEVKNGVAKIDIYGVKEEIEYEVRLDAKVINYIPYTTKTIQDSSLEPGRQVVDQNGANGVKTITYKYLVLNGNIISKTTVSTDTYNAQQKIVRVGV